MIHDLWYKNAIIYCLNVETFLDSDGDGIGDFVGLTDRLAYLAGLGASPDGDRPFLDRYEIATGKATRLFRSEAPYYESIVAVLDGEGGRAVTLRESSNDMPNYFIRDIATGKNK